MKAGRDLDRLVAEKCFRWDSCDGYAVPPSFSTNFHAAEGLLVKLDAKLGNHWAIVRRDNEYLLYENPYDIGDFSADVTGESIPHCLSLAALKFL